MGSLMAGWDSPVLGDDNRVRARRNKSLTREEVEAFWKQHGGEMPSSPLGSPAGAMARSASVGLSRAHASSSPRGGVRIDQATRVEGFFPDDEAAAAESPSKSRDWWTRSNWAFLNEPPQEEVAGKAQSYTPQFHVARIAAGNA
ncbi:hypothetical protein E2562_013971 [Oryza meyeriana var. granulata]|uniref:Uncharacterized protein n=1 Tax=Oryza meyeriana var. granulata TaxID=110450 RepID=A0A6G1DIH4_9ORYZ|nr:hypothetical protein E2562_013971 [Oryza meyeriana var. granulata]